MLCRFRAPRLAVNCRITRSVHARAVPLDMEREAATLQLSLVKPLPKHSVVPLTWHEFRHSKRQQYTSSEPIVLLHGLFGSLANYRSVGRRISHLTGRPIYGVDLRNHGSSPHAQPLDYDSLADDVVQLIKDQRWTNAALVGHSMGAKVAMLVALRHPELVSLLVVVDNSPESAPLEPQFLQDLVGLAHVERKNYDANISLSQKLTQARATLDPYEPDHLVQTFLLSNLLHSSTPRNLRIPVLEMLKYGVIKAVGSWPHVRATYRNPTLVLSAKHSNFVTDRNLQEDFPRYFINFSHKEYNSGHWIISERPEDFVGDVVHFLNTGCK